MPFDKKFEKIELAIYPNFVKSKCVLSFELFNEKKYFIK